MAFSANLRKPLVWHVVMTLIEHREGRALVGADHDGAGQLVAGFDFRIGLAGDEQAGLGFVGDVAATLLISWP